MKAAGAGPVPSKGFGAVHGELDGSTGLAGQDHRDRGHVIGELAAEAAADFGGDDADVRDRDAEHLADLVADAEVALGAAVDFEGAVGAPEGGGVVGFDVALVDGGGAEVAFHDQVGGGEAGVDVAFFQDDVLGDVARGVGEGAGGLHAQVGVQDGRARGAGGFGVEDGVENLVLDVDQAQGLGGDMCGEVAATAAMAWP